MKYSLAFALLIVSCISGLAQQDLTQTIRGQVVDLDAKAPIIGATVIILNSEPLKGSTTDLDGNFRIENVEAGRVELKVSFVGYEEKVVPNVTVNTGKEVVLRIELLESVLGLDEVVITADDEPKNEALNEMSIVSTRTFSVEETKRFAGSLNDPARMAANYAGVIGSPTGNNDIIVRGNPSGGILWRLEGIEIPNPNHFAYEGSTGGPINALNSAMLANSDFHTGAFAPEYGNALSGIFDMKLRQGNSEQREYDFSAGVIGVDMTLEGPFAKGKRASYLINARWSSLELLDNLGIVDFGGVPKYKDLAFKFHFPTKKAGAFSLFGLGGLSNITLDSTTTREIDQAEIQYYSDAKNHLGVTGLNHVYFINSNSYFESFASLASNGVEYIFENNNGALTEFGQHDIQSKGAFRAGTAFHSKINPKNRLETGVIYSLQDFLFDQEYEVFDTVYLAIDENNQAGLLQGYFSWKYRPTDRLTFVTGLHNTIFTLNNSFAIEPRASMQWKTGTRSSINFGTGLHSKPQTLPTYFVQVENPDGTFRSPNRDLALTKAAHFVTGYSIMLSEFTHLKLEAYYQYLFDIPVENDINSSTSSLNSIFTFEVMDYVSEGTGQNYGLELTLERFLSNDFYYLLTGSLYEAKYQALDGVMRNSRWNGNYSSNFLIGKEFHLRPKPKKQRTIALNGKVSYLGGMRYNPINLEESRVQTAMIRYDDPPYITKGDNIFLLNVGAAYRVNRKKTTQEVKLEVLNATNHAAVTEEIYAPWTKEIMEIKQWPLLPNIIYRIQF